MTSKINLILQYQRWLQVNLLKFPLNNAINSLKSDNHIIKSHAEENIHLGVFLSQIFSYRNHYLNKLVYLCRNI